jgi:CHAT domain-containing protein/predicted negative regulator of RcsB-dependent stress response
MKKVILFNLLISLNLILGTKIALANPQSLEQQAQQLYETGKLTEAIPLLQQAISERRNQGNLIKQADATRNLALIYQQLGDWQKANETISKAFEIVSQITDLKKRERLFAQSLDIKGQIQLSLGQSEQALETWKQAANIYQKIGDLTRFTKDRVAQAQALQALGLYAQAIKTLTQIQQQLEKEPDTLIKSQALLNLGDILRRIGKYEESQLALEHSLKIAEKIDSKQATADTLIGLGNTAKLQQKNKEALEYYERAIARSPLIDTKILGKLEQLNLLIAQKQWAQATNRVPEIESLLNQLPPSQTTINGWINLTRNLMKMEKEKQTFSLVNYLTTAIQQAQSIGDKRAEADAIGTLGTLYERHQRLDEAQQLTEKALIISQGIRATDLAYQWQWQLGRILKVKGDKKGAISAYSAAVKTLQSLRGDLVAISSQLQFSFRETVEPVYREFAGLLLQPGASQEDLKQARDTIEALQLAELDNFFRDACIDAKPVQIDQLDPTAAIFYTIILSDRLEVIVALPGKPLRHYTTNLTQAQIEEKLSTTSSAIQSIGQSLDFDWTLDVRPLQQLYDWFIRPIEVELAANRIKTLVFIPDGSLRNISPAVFHDGRNYLIEKYNIAIAPSLQLIDPQPLTQKNRELLLAGLTEARQGFIALPGVKSELESIKSAFPAQMLLNDSFTEPNFDKAVNTSPYQLVHLATHGQFSSKAEDTFILTWDDRININELNSLIRADKQQIRPIELLVLSACQTAAGDKQAALGLAGIAVRAGARSTLATLWNVSDESTTLLMSYFYQELANSNIPKAEALRRAQIKILQNKKFSHPYFWSAFILVGNWL